MQKILVEDLANKAGKHKLKNQQWEKGGVEVIRCPLPVGDYIIADKKVLDVIERKAKRGIPVKKMDFLGTYNVCVDSKFSIGELYSDVVGKAHERFRDECILAQNNGIKLYILVENTDGVRCLDDVAKWKNPRYTKYMATKNRQAQGKSLNVKLPSKPPMNSVSLMKLLYTFQSRYGCRFVFCHPFQSAEAILQLLGGDEDD